MRIVAVAPAEYEVRSRVSVAPPGCEGTSALTRVVSLVVSGVPRVYVVDPPAGAGVPSVCADWHAATKVKSSAIGMVRMVSPEVARDGSKMCALRHRAARCAASR